MADKKYWRGAAQKGEKNFRPNFPKSERLNTWEERAEIIAKGKSLRYQSMLISMIPHSQWGISIVLRKEVKPAYHRNYIKRLIREAYRTAKPFCEHPKKIAVTVVGNQNTLNLNELREVFINN